MDDDVECGGGGELGCFVGIDYLDFGGVVCV